MQKYIEQCVFVYIYKQKSTDKTNAVCLGSKMFKVCSPPEFSNSGFITTVSLRALSEDCRRLDWKVAKERSQWNSLVE